MADAYEQELIDRLGVRSRIVTSARRTPADLDRETGAVGGAIYGGAPHGRMGTLRRPGPVVRGVQGLYRCGGTAHPGGGLPIVALGGAIVARGSARHEPHARAAARHRRAAADRAGGARAAPPAARRRLRTATGAARVAGSSSSLVAGGERIDVGSGPRGAATSVRATRPTMRRSWSSCTGGSSTDPASYGTWIAHLVRRGATVIYPTYQEPPFADTVSPLPNTLVAMRLALEEVHVAAGRLVVAGHSAGGALAADYAASARAAGLPVPAAVFSVYPGRSLRGIPLRIPAVSARNIAARTRWLVLGWAPTTGWWARGQRARSC